MDTLVQTVERFAHIQRLEKIVNWNAIVAKHCAAHGLVVKVIMD